MIETVIRKATALDAVAVTKMLKKGYAERLLPYQAVTDSLAVEFVLRMILRGYTLVAERDARIVGVFASFVHAEEWSQLPYVDNAFFFVIPQERKRGTAERLLQLVHEDADKTGLFTRLGTFASDEDEESYIAFLRQKGYRYIGATFVREPRKSDEPKQKDDHGRRE